MQFTDADVPIAFPEFEVQVPRVGYGGSKVVYRIADKGEDLALKIVTEPVDDDLEDFDQSVDMERFRRELLAMAATDCPHIITVAHEPQLRVIATTKHVWYSEPFLSGGTLRERLKQGPLDPNEVHELARCLFLAVEAMWGSESQIVHRDINPKNIGYAADGTVVLIDLGAALITQMSGITSSSTAGPGTDVYAAPEQFVIRRMANIDFRTDLFQIGMVIVEALTGKHPFKGSPDYFTALTSFDPQSLDGVPMTDGLKATIPRLLASHQGRRFRKADMPRKTLDGEN